MSAAAVPRPRIARVKPLYGDKSAEEVREHMHGPYGRFLCMTISAQLDLTRIARNRSQIAFLLSVAAHTATSHKGNRQKPANFTPPMTAEDFGKERKVSAAHMASEMEDAVDRGLARRMCGCKKGAACANVNMAHYRFQLCLEDWPTLSDYETSGKLNGSKEGEKIANTHQTTVSRMEVGKPVRVAPGTQYEMPEDAPAKLLELDKAEGTPDIVARITDSGLLRITLRAGLVTTGRKNSPTGRKERGESTEQSTAQPPGTPTVPGAQTAPCLDPIVAALLNYCHPDDDGVAALLAACRKIAPDATPEEIAYFVHQRGPRAKKGNNPFGLLLTVVPPCFKGASFAATRAKLAPSAPQPPQELTAGQRASHIEAARKMLDDPACTDRDRDLAQEVLRDLGEEV